MIELRMGKGSGATHSKHRGTGPAWADRLSDARLSGGSDHVDPAKQRSRDPKTGYARDFVDMIARVLPDLKERRIRVIANAGGVNPTACKDAVLEVAKRQGISVSVATVEGDHIMDRLDSFIARGIELKSMDTGEPLR